MFFSYSALASSKTIALVHESLVTYRISEGASIQDNLTKFPTMEKCLCVYKALDALENYCLERSLLNGGLGISLDAACVILAFGATTKALGNDELLEQVFCAYQNALKNEWRVSKPLKSAGFEVRSKYELMVNSTAAQFAWVYKQAGQSRRGGKMRKALLGAKTALVIVQNRLRRKNLLSKFD